MGAPAQLIDGTVFNWNSWNWGSISSSSLDSLRWEAYAIQHCGNEELKGAISHHFSNVPMTAGRVSYLRDEAQRIIVLTFRGTANLINVVNDIWCGCTELSRINNEGQLPESLQNIELHRGFSYEYKGLQSHIQYVFDEMQAKQEQGWRLLVTGHSMGGALATLCIADILLNRLAIKADKLALVTFGSPRIGNRAFSQWIDGSGLYVNTRVEVEGDPVVLLPAQNDVAFFHRGQQTLIRYVNKAYERVKFSETCGEENDRLGDLGNTLSNHLRMFDVIDSVVSRWITSTVGAIIDVLAAQGSLGWVVTHNSYWSCLQYQQ
jgi:hypothetical protein